MLINKQYDNENIFAKILEKKLPAEITYENDNILCIKDKYPTAPIHNLVIPKNSYIDFRHFLKDASEAEKLDFLEAIAHELEQFEGGARVQINIEKDGGQVVFHMHAHVMGFKK